MKYLLLILLASCKTADYYQPTYSIDHVQGIDITDNRATLYYRDTVAANDEWTVFIIQKHRRKKDYIEFTLEYGSSIRIYDHEVIELYDDGKKLKSYKVVIGNKILGL